MDPLRQALDQSLSAGYRIERELGGGGMSRVFLAEEVALGRQVVVKVLPYELTATLSVDRFRREIQVAAKLQHPHIVPLLTAGDANGVLYFTMPFVEGSSLRSRLAKAPLPPADAVRIWRELLDALSYAHSHGVVHRDIKPENILLSGRHASVTDFGVARAMQAATGEERVTSTGTVLGTPAYMAPEQASAERDVDHRVDIYAAGLVMYEMLAGASPFQATSPRDMLVAHVMKEPEPLATKQPLVPAPLAALVMRCLAKDPAARPQNADAVLEELDRLALSSTLSPSAGVLPVKRPRTWIIATAAVILLAGSAVALAARGGKLGFGPPAPPAHDSLRLRVVTTSLQFDSADATLARRVRDAVLAELAKEPWIFVVTPSAFEQTAPWLGIDAKLLQIPDSIRKYARRGRNHALLDLSLARAAGGYVVTAQARAAASDSSLEAISEAAAGAADIPGAMERVAQRLRAQLVASRRTLPPTQPSWGVSARDVAPEAVEQLREAISDFDRRDLLGAVRRARGALSIDSTLVSAWLLIGYSLSNAGLDTRGRLEAVSRAYQLRDREPSPVMRLEIAAQYWDERGDYDRALAQYDSLSRLLPENVGLWNNMGLIYQRQRRFDLATRVFRRSIDSTYKYLNVVNGNLISSLLRQGRLDDARAEVARVVQSDSNHVVALSATSTLAAAIRDFETVHRTGERRLERARTSGDSLTPLNLFAQAAINRGMLRPYHGFVQQRSAILHAQGVHGNYLASQLQRARLHARLTGDTTAARRIADSALARVPWSSIDALDRPWAEMLQYSASIGDIKGGTDVASDWARSMPADWKHADSSAVLVGRGEVALAAGDPREALRLFRFGDRGACVPCSYPRFARSFDALAMRDSARFYFERFANALMVGNALVDAAELPHTYLRLGELAEERRDMSAAVKWYDKFTQLWSRADEPLRAKVREVQARADRLRKASG